MPIAAMQSMWKRGELSNGIITCFEKYFKRWRSVVADDKDDGVDIDDDEEVEDEEDSDEIEMTDNESGSFGVVLFNVAVRLLMEFDE